MEMASAISIPVSINSQENQDKKVKEEPIKKKKVISLCSVSESHVLYNLPKLGLG